MKLFITRILRRLGALRADLLVERTASFPDVSADDAGRLLLVEDGGVQKWACFTCPGGCGQSINLSLNPSRRPRWQTKSDFWLRPTITPSVHQQNACRCHFWVKKGRIEWCRGGRPRSSV